jgi:hypothetical protein
MYCTVVHCIILKSLKSLNLNHSMLVENLTIKNIYYYIYTGIYQPNVKIVIEILFTF